MTTGDPMSDRNANGIDFMRTEISMGLAFAKVASSAGDQIQKRERNRANAQKAYDGLLKFLPRLSLTAAESRELYSGAERCGWPSSPSRQQTDPLAIIRLTHYRVLVLAVWRITGSGRMAPS